MASAIKTMGATLKKGIVAITNLTDISRSGTAGGTMETTNLSSTNGVKTYETSGVFEQGELSIALNYDPSDVTHVALVTDFNDGSTDAYTVTFSNADAFIADMIVTAFDWANTLADDGKLEATATLKLAGSNITDPS